MYPLSNLWVNIHICLSNCTRQVHRFILSLWEVIDRSLQPGTTCAWCKRFVTCSPRHKTRCPSRYRGEILLARMTYFSCCSDDSSARDRWGWELLEEIYNISYIIYIYIPHFTPCLPLRSNYITAFYLASQHMFFPSKCFRPLTFTTKGGCPASGWFPMVHFWRVPILPVQVTASSSTAFAVHPPASWRENIHGSSHF